MRSVADSPHEIVCANYFARLGFFNQIMGAQLGQRGVTITSMRQPKGCLIISQATGRFFNVRFLHSDHRAESRATQFMLALDRSQKSSLSAPPVLFQAVSQRLVERFVPRQQT